MVCLVDSELVMVAAEPFPDMVIYYLLETEALDFHVHAFCLWLLLWLIGRGSGRAGHHFNRANFQRGRGFYQHGRNHSSRMGPTEYDFDNRYTEFHGRQFIGRGSLSLSLSELVCWCIHVHNYTSMYELTHRGWSYNLIYITYRRKEFQRWL